jgi:hypothetical protein
MTKTTHRQAANIRVYCDNDEYGPGKRWTLVPDNEATPGRQPNSKRTRKVDQEWEDVLNGVKMPHQTMGCIEREDNGILYDAAELTKKYEYEERNRTTVTVRLSNYPGHIFILVNRS